MHSERHPRENAREGHVGEQAWSQCPAPQSRWLLPLPASPRPPGIQAFLTRTGPHHNPSTHSVSRLCSPSKLWVPRCWMRLL